jgi:hypothetical protein
MNMNNIQTRIAKAADTTRRVVPGYFEKTLAQRAELSGSAAGSIYPGVDEAQLEQMLLTADWEEYSHPAVMSECVAYKANIPGKLGIVDLASLPVETVVTLDDRKNTGKVSATVKGVRGQDVDFTVLILGPEQGEEVIFTFHPGDPVSPSQVQVEPGTHGRQVTVSEAQGMGLGTAKIV